MLKLADLVADLRAQKVDHVAVTGDIVNLGLREEFRRAETWMHALGNPEHVSFVPGNHDAYVKDALLPLAQHLAPWTEDYRFPYLRRRGEVALIGLNSARPTAPLLATGRLGQGQLTRLVEMLKESQGLARVVMIHHPPFHTGVTHRLRGLDDVASLEAIIAQYGAEVILHGHNHRVATHYMPSSATRNIQGAVWVIGASSASAEAAEASHMAAYHCLALERQGDAWRIEGRSRGFLSGGVIVERELC